MTREKLANTDLDDKELCVGCKHRNHEFFEDPCRVCFELVVRATHYEGTCENCRFAEPLIPGVSFRCKKTGTMNGVFGCAHYEEENDGKIV